MPKTDAERAADYRQRRKDQGMTQIRVWVPEDKETAVRMAISAALEENGCDRYEVE